jgi:hypothetical protein
MRMVPLSLLEELEMRQFNGTEIAALLADVINAVIQKVVEDEICDTKRKLINKQFEIDGAVINIKRLEELLTYYRDRTCTTERKSLKEVIMQEPKQKED